MAAVTLWGSLSPIPGSKRPPPRLSRGLPYFEAQRVFIRRYRVSSHRRGPAVFEGGTGCRHRIGVRQLLAHPSTAAEFGC